MRDGVIKVSVRAREVEVGGEGIENVAGGVGSLLLLLVRRGVISLWAFLFVTCSFPCF